MSLAGYSPRGSKASDRTKQLILSKVIFKSPLHFFKNLELGDLSGGPVIENLPASAGETGLIPGLGRFCMPEHSRACDQHYEKPPQRDAHELQLECRPHSLQLEKVHKQQ